MELINKDKLELYTVFARGAILWYPRMCIKMAAVARQKDAVEML